MTEATGPSADLDAEGVFQQALGKLQAGDSRGARELCESLLKQTPKQPALLTLLGAVELEEGHAERGFGLVSRAIELAPGYAMAHFQLGCILDSMGRNAEAGHSFVKATECHPSLPHAHANAGMAFRAAGELDEAERQFRLSIDKVPQNVFGHVGLADLLRMQERFEEAIERYRQAVELNPGIDMSLVQVNLGASLKGAGRYEEALEQLAKTNAPAAVSVALESLLEMHRYEDGFSLIERTAESHATDLRVSAISAYVAEQLGRDDPHRFCPQPMSGIRIIENLGLDDADEAKSLIEALLQQYDSFRKIRDPASNATTNGFQTVGNIFEPPVGALARLRQILLSQMDRYRGEVCQSSTTMAEAWPDDGFLYGWYVRLFEGGFEDAHIHPHGWLSGVTYLQLPPDMEGDDGAIEFSTMGRWSARGDREPSRLVHRPSVGQLILFPSTVYHRTIPFSSTTDRVSLAFDLCPSSP